MSEKTAIETFGRLTKEEFITSLDNNIKKGSLVVEQLEAFPGYHHAVPKHSQMGHLFLLLKEPIEVLELMRISKKIEKYMNIKLDAVAGSITFENKTHPCIRLRGLDSYEIIPEIQDWYYDAGLEFAKAKQVKARALIELKKPFFIEQVEDFIYHDLDEDKTWYLQVNQELSWKLFKEITQLVKNNLKDINFDAAYAGVYRRFGFIDAVRVYTEETDIDKLKTILSTYEMVCKKYV